MIIFAPKKCMTLRVGRITGHDMAIIDAIHEIDRGALTLSPNHLITLSQWRVLRAQLKTPPPLSDRPPSHHLTSVIDITLKNIPGSYLRGVQCTTPCVLTYETLNWIAMPDYTEGEEDFGDVDFHKIHLHKTTAGGSGGWTFFNLFHRFNDIDIRFNDLHNGVMTFLQYGKYLSLVSYEDEDEPENDAPLRDPSPLAVYDSFMATDWIDLDGTSNTHSEYSVPSVFGLDLFDLAEPLPDSDIHRPPYRWVLIGPPRSGTGIHIDPLLTSAWVTLLQGCKRWVLFPPETDANLIGLKEDEQSIFWFKNRYESLKARSNIKMIEVLQMPGETVYIPAGWPHVVINLELSVAVTHNYASEVFLEEIWGSLCREGEGEFALRWLEGLKANGLDDLVDRIRKCHEEDGLGEFVSASFSS